MRLKNILIVVSDIERSKQFYHELFGLQVIRDFGDNVILSDGLVLQEQSAWEQLIESEMIIGNASELFFEENDLDDFLLSIEKYPKKIEVIGNIRENSMGRRVVMLKDPDGHLIEVTDI